MKIVLANLETSFWGFLKNGNFQKNSVKISFKIFQLNWLYKECFEKLFLKRKLDKTASPKSKFLEITILIFANIKF